MRHPPPRRARRSAATVIATRRERVDRALEAVNDMRLSAHDHVQRLVVIVPAHPSRTTSSSPSVPPRSTTRRRLASALGADRALGNYGALIRRRGGACARRRAGLPRAASAEPIVNAEVRIAATLMPPARRLPRHRWRSCPGTGPRECAPSRMRSCSPRARRLGRSESPWLTATSPGDCPVVRGRRRPGGFQDRAAAWGTTSLSAIE